MSYYKIIENGNVVGASEIRISNEVQECVEINKIEYDEIKSILDDKHIKEKLNQDEILERDNWFKTDYTKYVQMFTRRKALGIEDVIEDEFRNRVGENAYHNLIELYEEAEIVAKEIRELRG